eukprot:gene10563-10723_t
MEFNAVMGCTEQKTGEAAADDNPTGGGQDLSHEVVRITKGIDGFLTTAAQNSPVSDVAGSVVQQVMAFICSSNPSEAADGRLLLQEMLKQQMLIIKEVLADLKQLGYAGNDAAGRVVEYHSARSSQVVSDDGGIVSYAANISNEEELGQPLAVGKLKELGTSKRRRDADSEEQLPEEKVLFATDRDYDIIKKDTSGYGFGTQQNKTLMFGEATVTLPTKRKPGEETAQGMTWIDRGRVNDSNRHYYFINLSRKDVQVRLPTSGGEEADKSWLLKQLGEAISKSGQRQLLLYVHGYNNHFDDAIKAAAQLVVDTAADRHHSNFDSYGPRAALAFDWASCADVSSYGFVPWQNDLRRAEDAAPKLAKLLCWLSEVEDCDGIHILCHSMGNYVFHRAMTDRLQISLKPGDLQMTKDGAQELFAKVRSIMFAAADIGRHDMERLLRELVVTPSHKEGRQLVLYCSSGDTPLMFSSLLRQLGSDYQGRAGYFCQDGNRHKVHPFMQEVNAKDRMTHRPWLLQTVDASGFSTDLLGHGYFRTSRALLADIANVLAGKEREGNTVRLRLEKEFSHTLAAAPVA